MPKSPLEIDIEKATNENNVAEDWSIIMEIVDQINYGNGEKEAIRLLTKRLNDRNPHIINHTITLLGACVSNCNRNFKLEVCSRVFTDELRNFIMKRRHPKLSDRMAALLESWSNDSEFKNDPALNLIPSLYLDLKRNGAEFLQPQLTQKMKQTNTLTAEALREEEELARAIQLSLKESGGAASSSSSSSSSGASSQSKMSSSGAGVASLYSSLLPTGANAPKRPANGTIERRKVKALYDFEAVEDNEITFKAGDLLFITDETDENWWKGTDMRGNEGLFPSNFVTPDLAFEVETYETSSRRVSFNNKVNVKLLEKEEELPPAKIENFIDEKKIDDCIELLQNADPTGEIQPDTRQMLELEDQCYMMGPLIDQQLQKIDHKHAVLEDLNLKILEAFQIYNNLMKESITKTAGLIGAQSSAPFDSFGSAAAMGRLATGAQQAAAMGEQIAYVAAPPSIEHNSMMLANQLSSITAAAAATGGNVNAAAALQAMPSQLMNMSNIPNMSIYQQHQQQQQQPMPPQQQMYAAPGSFVADMSHVQTQMGTTQQPMFVGAGNLNAAMTQQPGLPPQQQQQHMMQQPINNMISK